MHKLIFFLPISCIVLILPWIYIAWSVHSLVYRDIKLIPERDVGLLLGTSPSSSDGRANLFYTTRIEATKILYEQGKIHRILVSGDNGTSSYNEPARMKESLIRAGIPEAVISLDYAGFRTLDSVIRAKEIFSLTGDITIISQPFQIERALFVAKSHGINAIGFGAMNVSPLIAPRVYIREIFARWLALFDIWMGTEPIVLGEPETINPE